MTGENVPFTSGERAHINYEGSLKPAKKPYNIGIGALFLWLVFVFLIVTVLWQDNKIDNLKDAIKTDANKIEFLQKELLMMDSGKLLKRKNGN